MPQISDDDRHADALFEALDISVETLLDALRTSELTLTQAGDLFREAAPDVFGQLPADAFDAILLEVVEGLDGLLVRGERDELGDLVDPNNATLLSTVGYLDGICIVHRVKEDEVEHRALSLEGALGIIDWGLPSDALLDQWGDPVEIEMEVGVPERVGELRPGSLVSVTRDRAVLRFELLDPAEVGEGVAELDAVAERLAVAVSGGIGQELDTAVIEALVDDPSLFRSPVLPIAEALEARGFESRGVWWGPSGARWLTPGEQYRESQLDIATELYGLERSEVARLDRAWETFSMWNVAESGDPVDLVPLAEGLADGLVAWAWFDLVDTIWRRLDLDQRQRLVEDVEEAAPDSIGALILRARHHEAMGQVREAERGYREVLRRDGDHLGALVRAMAAAVDASRYDEAARLLTRVEGPQSPRVRSLNDIASQLQTAGRNDSCPCGSGRKYKQCHAGAPLLDAQSRTRGMIYKVERFTDEAVAGELFGFSADRSLWAELVAHEVARDFMIHEGGFLQRFVDERVEVIPPEELERFAAWLQGRRDLYEVVEVDPGLRLGLRNVRTGDRHDVLEHVGSLEASIGEYRLLRLETHGGVTTSYGAGASVPAEDRDRLLWILDAPEPSIEDLLDWVVDRLRPPTIVDRSGTEVQSYAATLATSASALQVAALLDVTGAFEPGDGSRDDEPLDRTWHFGGGNDRDGGAGAFGDPGSLGAMSATVWLVEDDPAKLEVIALSETQFEAAVAQLLDVLPHAQEIDREVGSVWETGERLGSLPGAGADVGISESDDPELAALLADHLQALEREWIDESIPALGGATPREALHDPTGREDLLRLLNSMPDSPNGFSAARLRALLGVDEAGDAL